MRTHVDDYLTEIGHVYYMRRTREACTFLYILNSLGMCDSTYFDSIGGLDMLIATMQDVAE